MLTEADTVPLATGLAVFVVVTAFAPSPPERTPVVALARDTPGGTPLVAGDLVVVSLPPDADTEAPDTQDDGALSEPAAEREATVTGRQVHRYARSSGPRNQPRRTSKSKRK